MNRLGIIINFCRLDCVLDFFLIFMTEYQVSMKLQQRNL